MSRVSIMSNGSLFSFMVGTLSSLPFGCIYGVQDAAATWACVFGRVFERDLCLPSLSPAIDARDGLKGGSRRSVFGRIHVFFHSGCSCVLRVLTTLLNVGAYMQELYMHIADHCRSAQLRQHGYFDENFGALRSLSRYQVQRAYSSARGFPRINPSP